MSVRTDVDRGIEIRDAMDRLSTELKDIEVRLKAAALHGEQVDLKDADRDGKQFLATGTKLIVPVVLTADKIVGEFAMNSDRHQDVLDSLHTFDDRQEKFVEFFKPVRKYENRFDDGKKFRKQADEVLGEKAPAFITACIARGKDGIAKSDIKVCWDDAETKQ